MLVSSSEDRIYQADPPDGHKRASGWRTINGYIREANKLSKCLRINAKETRPYPLEAVVKFAGDMTPEEHNKLWKKFTRNMKIKGIVALWVREPTKKNRIHYHLILAAPDAAKAAEDAIVSACPKGFTDRLKLHVGAVRNQHAICDYIVKAKAKGYDAHGKYVLDKYQHKRLLFAPHITLDKYGSVGPFWGRPKADIWREIIARERGISMYKADVYGEARRLHAYVADDVPLHVVERNLAYFAWRDSLAKTDPDATVV